MKRLFAVAMISSVLVVASATAGASNFSLQRSPYQIHYHFEEGWTGDYAPGWVDSGYRHGDPPVATMEQIELSPYGRPGSYGAKITVDSVTETGQYWGIVHSENLHPGAFDKQYNPWVSVDWYDYGYFTGLDVAGQLYNVPPSVVEDDWTDTMIGGVTPENANDTYWFNWAWGDAGGSWQNSGVDRPEGGDGRWVNLKMQLSDDDGRIHYYIDDVFVGSTARDDYIGLGWPSFNVVFDSPLDDWGQDLPYAVIGNFKYGSDLRIPIPEPAGLSLLGMALLGLKRKRRR